MTINDIAFLSILGAFAIGLPVTVVVIGVLLRRRTRLIKANEGKKDLESDGGKKSLLFNQALAVILGAAIASSVSLIQVVVQYQTETRRVETDRQVRLFDARRQAYDRVLKLFDEIEERLRDGSFRRQARKRGTSARKATLALFDEVRRLEFVATPAVMAEADYVKTVLGAAVTDPGAIYDYTEAREKFVNAVRRELGISARSDQEYLRLRR